LLFQKVFFRESLAMRNDFYGHPVGVLQNDLLRLEYLFQAGPRIVRLSLAGSSENLLAETPEVSWETPYGTYHLYGGHRLWCAPEKAGITSQPDDADLRIELISQGVRLIGAPQPVGGLSKILEVRLEAGRAGVRLRHRLTNHGDAPVELAPWAITQLPLGGQAILPQPTQPVDKDGLLPNRSLVLWPYTHWCDPRLKLGDEMIIVNGIPLADKFKIGYKNCSGWAGYLRQGIFFGKKFETHEHGNYADLGCNLEIYCDHRCLELETLGPLCTLEPGEALDYAEEWIILTGIESYENLDLILSRMK
jgi:hypothetical protein